MQVSAIETIENEDGSLLISFEADEEFKNKLMTKGLILLILQEISGLSEIDLIKQFMETK